MLQYAHVSKIWESLCTTIEAFHLDISKKRSRKVSTGSNVLSGCHVIYIKKALFIQTPVWPFALYSCDTTYIGQKHFDKLRRATVNALVGHWHNASPMLACNFLSKFLMDPFLYTLCQCIRIVRRLATVQHDLAVNTVQTTDCSF